MLNPLPWKESLSTYLSIKRSGIEKKSYVGKGFGVIRTEKAREREPWRERASLGIGIQI